MSNMVQKPQNIDELKKPGLIFTNEDRLILRKKYPDLTPDQLEEFIRFAEKKNLDPNSRHIYPVLRWNKKDNRYDLAIQTGIDGYRLIAARTGEYGGNDDTHFDDDNEPNKGTTTVYRIVQGVRCPFTGSARWREYYPEKGTTAMWDKMPCTMLGKVSEALALRKGFPEELSGMYIKEEMDQADEDETSKKGSFSNQEPKQIEAPKQLEGPKQIIAPKSTPTPSNGKIIGVASEVKATEKQLKFIRDLMDKKGATQGDIESILGGFNKINLEDITMGQAKTIIDALLNGEWGKAALSPQEPPKNEIPLPDDADLPWDQVDRYELVK